MKKTLHEEIMYMLGQIDGKMAGIIDRLDKINGAISSHSSKIRSLEDSDNNRKGQTRIIAVVTSFFTAVILIVIRWFITK